MARNWPGGNAAARALHAFEEAHKLDLGEAVREAIDDGVAGPEAGSDG